MTDSFHGHLEEIRREVQDLTPEEAEEALGSLEIVRTRLLRQALAARTQERAPLMTAREVALRLNMHRQDVYHLVESGQLKALRTGTTRMRFEPIEIDRYLSIRRARGA